ncbi:MAG TPA: LLM class F420-dependent oxidoreductase [Candidatus Limnocylindrales bacterium]|nr:LLM class F420-dependent oxidoreductase [Candidatus Limnocylindrales bacterium]
MRIGVVFPQIESGTDVGAIRDYLQAVEQLGYVHLVTYDHVLGADSTTRPDWNGPYDHRSLFHEPFVFFGFAAALTRLELAPAVIVLPQRHVALVAKQAAEVDVLTGGRTRMGVGIGWNRVEYEALGAHFGDRARRMEEQIEILRLLWTQPVVDYTGRWHRIDRAGLNPLPVQRPIPLWMGGDAEEAIKRIARIGDGWFTHEQPNEKGRATFERFRGYLRDAGRDADAYPIEGRVNTARLDGPDQWVKTAMGFGEMGCTHLEINTMGAGYTSLAQHQKAIERFRQDAASLFTASSR